jgi:hypothetical protein
MAASSLHSLYTHLVCVCVCTYYPACRLFSGQPVFPAQKKKCCWRHTLDTTRFLNFNKKKKIPQVLLRGRSV